MTHKWEANTVAEVLPKGVRNPNLYQALQTRGSNTGTVSPQNFQHRKPAGLEFGRAEGLQDTDCASQISQALSPKAEAVIFKEPGSEPLADLSLLERQETTGNPPGNKSIRGSLLGGLLTLVMSSAILESSLHTVSTRHSTAHQQASTIP